ncbi:MAG TPA: alkaline phosphatase family protein [Myxococcales bacterium]|nr:alkaline phosphatase family protein [Myxococcales bacterium]
MILAILLSAAAASASQGRLVVLVVVDQLRYQDLLWLEPQLGPKGFAGLGRPSPLRYETVVTETAADHAVLSTGAYAELNGIVGNRYFDETGDHEAVDDPRCPVWGAPPLRGRSAAALRAPTVGDAFKLNTNGQGRVVSVSVKDRSALFLAGPSADLALWFDTESGQMVSSTCYAPGPPGWVPRDPAAPYRTWTWTMERPDVIAKLLPEPRASGSVPRQDIGPEFPHKVGLGALDQRLYWAVRNSPASTTIALQAARAAVKALALGESGGTDHLALALSAVDGVGHQFGTLARERVDTILRMHEELGAFLDELRARLGPRLSVVLTADHGLTPTAADEQRMRVVQGGTEDIDQLIPKLEKAISEVLGPRDPHWVATIDGSSLFLRPPYPPRAVQVAAEALRREPGFWQVLTADEIATAAPAVRHAYFPGRSGQVLLVPRPLWTLKKRDDAADHGSPWNDDALVPLLVHVPGFRLRHDGIFRATQVAPTVAALLDTSPPAAAMDLPAIEHE